MKWADGLSGLLDANPVEMVSSDGAIERVEVKALIKGGLPDVSRTTRSVFEGVLTDWHSGEPDSYLTALGAAPNFSPTNRHVVFQHKNHDGTTLHVPALALLRAFFRPSNLIFPSVFCPGSIDLLSFVDYSTTPPTVVIDDQHLAAFISTKVHSASREKSLLWLQASLSARRTAQSIYDHATSGRIGMQLPAGSMRIVFHGICIGIHLYVTRATLISVDVNAEDSITGSAKKFIFHAMADDARRPAASIRDLVVTSRPDGLFTLTDKEWGRVEPMLIGKQKTAFLHSRRAILDSILMKLSTGASWKTVPRGAFTVNDTTAAFRRWSTSGRLQKVLEYLEHTRS